MAYIQYLVPFSFKYQLGLRETGSLLLPPSTLKNHLDVVGIEPGSLSMHATALSIPLTPLMFEGLCHKIHEVSSSQ